MIILTSGGGIFYNFGKPDEVELHDVTAGELEKHIADDEFAKGSMLPKVQAAVNFVNATGNPAVIGDLKDVKNIIKGTEGTVIRAN
ncbi:carbamate kinase [Lentilactobacillus kosonis]|uniref:carbamate kinase n=1 Tax=Lentilactobacillus kosonis TaxID=2810561 RepID=A0A401FIP3_9LACO|nr:carbamate kinase [Lentilactobacillus kosonis]